MIEILLQVAASFSDAVLGGSAVDTLLWTSQPPPPHAALYTQYFRTRVEFNAAFSGILLPASLRALPCPLHDEKTYHASLARCREALDAVLSPDDVVARATHWMAAHFDQIAARGHAVSQPRLEQLAGALHMSPRTLIRQLTDRGTSFTELREAQQLAIAQRLLGGRPLFGQRGRGPDRLRGRGQLRARVPQGHRRVTRSVPSRASSMKRAALSLRFVELVSTH